MFAAKKENRDKYNEALENVATMLSGVFEIDVVFRIIYWKQKISDMMDCAHQPIMVYINLSKMF